MQAHDVLTRAHPRALTRPEYDRIVEQGIFRDERVELICGMVVSMSPIGASHADPVDYLNQHFVRSLGDRARVRVQQPFALSHDSEPEPDLCLVPPGRYAKGHPDAAFLIIEVAVASLEHDRETKAPLYAAGGVPEYWIVDVGGRTVWVFDQPEAGRYTRARDFKGDVELAPAAFSDAGLIVSDLFAS